MKEVHDTCKACGICSCLHPYNWDGVCMYTKAEIEQYTEAKKKKVLALPLKRDKLTV